MNSPASIAAARERHCSPRALPETIKLPASDASRSGLVELSFVRATVDDPAFAVGLLRRWAQNLAKLEYALGKLCDQARERGAVGATPVAAFPAVLGLSER